MSSQQNTIIDESVVQGLYCIYCGSNKLVGNVNYLECKSCSQKYPLIEGIPVLINEEASVFKFDDFLEKENLFFNITKSGKFISRIAKMLPDIDNNKVSKKNYSNLGKILGSVDFRPRVLVLGGSVIGQGMQDFLQLSGIDFIESDVSLGPRTQIIVDAHTIPYEAETFDCVIAQAVLEHVLDPFQCVAEIHRVLKPNGLVYAETPFMQPVHGGRYDFTRFSHSGHRRLFRYFEEVDSGMISGPGAAFAWSYQYLLLSLFGFSSSARLVVKSFARLTGFWLKYLDYLMSWNTKAIDSASGIYFMGSKTDVVFSDMDIIAYYNED